MHIILTGEQQVGKTTLAWKLGNDLRAIGFRTVGFVTRQVDDGLVLQNLAGGEPVRIAYTDRPGKDIKHTQIGRYFFLDDVLRFAGHMLRWPGDVLVVDEMGLWEASGGGLIDAFDEINSRVPHSIVVVRKSVLPLIKSNYHREPMVIEVTTRNREQVYHAVMHRFRQFRNTEELGRINYH
ncbi:MAG: hypothetical protein GX058_01190 [Firmicutes bacterium]|nr:hypothetical protein [Bacillota bacterium]